jgi:hypothetical protein
MLKRETFFLWLIRIALEAEELPGEYFRALRTRRNRRYLNNIKHILGLNSTIIIEALSLD